MSTLVMKFGGSLTADARSIQRVAQIILAEKLAWSQMVVVISAMAGATDGLARAAEMAATHDGVGYRRQIAAIRAQHVGVIEALFRTLPAREMLHKRIDHWLFDALTACDSIAARHETLPRDRDAVMIVGERMMADILLALVQAEGLRSALIDSASWMITDNHHQNANPLLEVVEERIERVMRPALTAGIAVLTEGFIGATRGGAMTTLGRGGSDYTATILASILHADEVWMWTRVDGIMSADPQLVPNARVIDMLSYDEIRELSYFGVRVLHPRAVDPLLPDAIPMRIRNPAGVDHVGTVIHAQSAPGGLKAVSAIDGLFLSTSQAGIDLPEVLAQVNHLVGQAATGPVITVQSQGRSTLVFVVPTSEGPGAAAVAAQKLSAALPLWEVRTVKVIAAMGATVQNNNLPGIKALASAQGAGNRRVLAVAPEDVQAAVRYLHQLF